MFRLIMLTMLVGCGNIKLEPQFIDEEFSGYVNTYTEHYSPIESTMQFDSLPDNVAGLCQTFSDVRKRNLIKIDVDIWRLSNHYQREQLIMHELGHCELRLGHNDKIEGGCPVSIMNFRMFDSYEIEHCYKNKRVSLIQNLGKENTSLLHRECKH